MCQVLSHIREPRHWFSMKCHKLVCMHMVHVFRHFPHQTTGCLCRWVAQKVEMHLHFTKSGLLELVHDASKQHVYSFTHTFETP